MMKKPDAGQNDLISQSTALDRVDFFWQLCGAFQDRREIWGIFTVSGLE